VLVIKEARGLGLGKELIKEALKKMNSEHHALAISLSAQLYLLKFYESFGFHAVSEAYDEDGIQHIDMLKQ
jgi:ElaA protein